MGTIDLKVVGASLFFLFIFLSGIWLSRSGKPLNGLVVTIHKLIALAAGIFMIITLYRMNQATALAATELIAALVAGLSFLGMAVSGGLLSTGKPTPPAILRLHQVVSVVTVLSTAVTLYLLAIS